MMKGNSLIRRITQKPPLDKLELLFIFIGFSLLGAVAIVLILGIYTLFKGGSTSK